MDRDPDSPEPPAEGSIVPAGPPPPPPAPGRPGLSTFTIEGRAAPGLYVVGWLASISGLALVLMGGVWPSGLILYFAGPVVLTIGLVAGAGSQAMERRSRGLAYAGPSPYLVFAAIIAATFALGAIVGVVLHVVIGSADVPDYVVNLIGVALQAI